MDQRPNLNPETLKLLKRTPTAHGLTPSINRWEGLHENKSSSTPKDTTVELTDRPHNGGRWGSSATVQTRKNLQKLNMGKKHCQSRNG